MKNDLRTDISIDRAAMTKEEAEAYDAFIDLLAELCVKYGDSNESQVSGESVV